MSFARGHRKKSRRKSHSTNRLVAERFNPLSFAMLSMRVQFDSAVRVRRGESMSREVKRFDGTR